MEQSKEYYAFISYKREDKKEAKRLQHALEYYRLPNHLRQENPELPEYVRPVFRDMTDLEVGELSAQIHTSLEQSHFLIVVCSPRAAASKWVNDEVEYFISLGKQDKIIPYIIEGVPHASNLNEECYPPALQRLSKEKELLGANINEVGKDSATIRVVSRMFNIRFDTLYQRSEREQKRKRWLWIGGSVLIAFLGLSIGGFFVRQNGIIERQNERLQQDSIAMANHLLRIQNDSVLLSAQKDSIVSQNKLIISQRDSIEHSVQQLQLSNRLLAQERDNVINAIWQTKESYAKVVAQEASRMCKDGNACGAIAMLLDVIPNKDNHFNYPIVPEVEASFRQANDSILFSRGHIGLIKKHHLTEYMSISLSKTGKLVTGSGREVCVWNLYTAQEYKELSIHLKNRCNSTLINSDGNIILAGCNGELKAKIIGSTGKIKEITISNRFDGSSSNDLHISLDSEYIVYKDLDGHYRFVYINSLMEFWTIGDLRQLVLSQDSKYAISLSNDKTVSVWDIKQKSKITSFKVECNIHWAEISVSPDGKSLKIEDPQEINIWNIAKGCKEDYLDPFVFSKQTNNVHVVCSKGVDNTIGDSTFIVRVHENGTISISKRNIKSRITKMHKNFTDSLLFNHTFSDAVPCYYNKKDSTLVVKGKKVEIPFNKSVFSYYCLQYDVDETLTHMVINYPMDHDVYIWNINENKVDDKLSHNTVIRTVSFSSNSEYVITQTDDGYWHFWNVSTGNKDYCIKAGFYLNMDLSYDNRYAYNLGSSVYLWDVRTGKRMNTSIQLESMNPSSIYLDSHNTHFITSDNNLIQLWDFKTGVELWRYCFNNLEEFNNRYFVNFCEGGIRVLNKEYGKKPIIFFMEFDGFDVLVDKYKRLYNKK